ncbi:MAG: sensor histidine kinase [Candidatus Hodarchaeales archaeon]|jgi:signal transduction histidine kinase
MKTKQMQIVQTKEISKWFREDGSLYPPCITCDIHEKCEKCEFSTYIIDLRKQRKELTEFTYSMSHDLSSSLFIISGLCKLLEENYNPYYVQQIYKQTLSIQKLLDHSLRLAELGVAIRKTDRINLNQLIDELAELIIPKDIIFIHDVLPKTILGDHLKVFQIFKNLLENAVVHGNPKKIEIKLKKLEKVNQLLIINDGTRIPLEIQDKIFNPGFSIKKGRNGFGLAIVKKLIEAHGWQIQFHSNSKSTIFYIIIPEE